MRTKWIRRLAILALSLTPAMGLASDNLRDYAEDRGRDFADIFRARTAVPTDPFSFALKARATSLAQVGAVRFKGRLYGVDRRDAGCWDQTRKEVGASLLYFSSIESEPKTLECPTGERNYDPDYLHYNGWDDGQKRPCSFGLMLQPFCLPGIDLGLYPSEALDFILGLTGVDMLRDDAPESPRKSVKPLMAGEPGFNDPRDFAYDESYADDLEPYVFSPSPAGKNAHKADNE